ncbi:hypothetical protein GCM10010869_16480 [Mesorhizobium tianshanense]|uniref:Uncharacterized protein DUF982 n=1 Tax=Mesorhizobium tianshanense TaxID=39844 RepID=A0A562NWE8_9HYPH|nr:DUF982 domain-containing protein [Mesorhizobium tianshanense]TWI36401.1 uncharacterized protein DUF982 [Mesorhizobium tianshanense]GLS36059.1 hypothetical protein GCM10010869_16480 [Mesorhizobium tianshanense]
MALHWFSPPLYVKTDRPGVRFGVSHVEGAAEKLLSWTKRGPRWRHAVELCMEGLQGRVAPAAVRDAFEAAAKEEGMFLPAE